MTIAQHVCMHIKRERHVGSITSRFERDVEIVTQSWIKTGIGSGPDLPSACLS